MIIVTELNGQATTGELREPRGILTALHVESQPGCHVRLQLGSAGLFVRRGDIVVVYPLETILKHVGVIAPDLLSPAPAPAEIAVTSR